MTETLEFINDVPFSLMSDEAARDTSTPRKQWQCMEYHSGIDPHTGRRISQKWTCKDPHTCPFCRKAKQQELRERLTPLLDNNTIKVQLIPLSQRDSVNKTYGTDIVLHLPGLDECYTLVNDPDAPGIDFNADMLEVLVEKAVPPKGKRISGNLGKPKKEPMPVTETQQDESDRGEVSRSVFKFVDDNGDNVTDKELIEKIDQAVIEETQDLDPKTIEEVQNCLYLLEEKTIEIAARYEVQILFLYTENTLVFINRIDWKGRKEWSKKMIN